MVKSFDNLFNNLKRTVNVKAKNQENDRARERILISAKKEFAKKGFHGARMGEIAGDAGVNKALIHYYFSNKESLYRQVMMRAFGLGERKEIAIYTDKWQLDPPQKLYILLYFIVSLILRDNDRDRYRLLYWEIVEGNRLHVQGIRQFVIPLVNLVADIMREGIVKEEFSTEDPQLLTMFMVFSVLHFNLDREIFGDSPLFNELYGNKNDEDVMRTLINNIFKTLSPRNRWLTVPEIPEEIIRFLDRLVEVAMASSNEGYAEELFMKLKEVIE